MEPPDLDIGEPMEGTNSGVRRFPSTKEIRAAQLQLRAEAETWLATCRSICELRLPPEVFKSIPEDLFRVSLWGTKVIVKRAPKVDQFGCIVTPQNAQRDNAHRWVINV